MGIRIASAKDSSKLWAIHRKALLVGSKNFYTDEQMKVWVDDLSSDTYEEGMKKEEIFVFEENDNIMGFGQAKKGEIVRIFVDPEFQERGIGKELFDQALRIASKEVKKVKVESTLNAQSFYEKYGFEKIMDKFVERKGVKIPIIVLEYSVT